MFSGIIRKDRDADDSARPNVKMGGNLYKILYVCLLQILPLFFQKHIFVSDLSVYPVSNFSM